MKELKIRESNIIMTSISVHLLLTDTILRSLECPREQSFVSISSLHTYHSVISCSTDSTYSLVIGQTVGSTNVAANRGAGSQTVGSTMNVKDATTRRRQAADETVFRIYKGKLRTTLQ